jgi:hypothetical protein
MDWLALSTRTVTKLLADRILETVDQAEWDAIEQHSGSPHVERNRALQIE